MSPEILKVIDQFSLVVQLQTLSEFLYKDRVFFKMSVLFVLFPNIHISGLFQTIHKRKIFKCLHFLGVWSAILKISYDGIPRRNVLVCTKRVAQNPLLQYCH